MAYVDDILIVGSNDDIVKNVIGRVCQEFTLEEFGTASEFIRIALIHDKQRGTIFLNQASAIRRALKKFNMSDCRPISSPTDKSVRALLKSESLPITDVLYRRDIESNLYFATCTRPNISYAVSILAQYCEAPNTAHWMMVKRIFRNLRGAESLGIVYECHEKDNAMDEFVGYTDADWAGLPDRRSTNGSVLLYDGCIVTRKSRNQGLVVLSTTEAEMIALVEAFKEHKCVHKIFEESNIVRQTWLVYCDDRAVIQISHDTEYTG